jgi:transporter family-2 protein
MQTLLYAVALLAGIGLTLQIGLNAALRTTFGSAGIAALTNFLVGTAGLVLFLLATRTSLPDRSALGAAPGWAWFGGLLGAFYVATATIAGPRIGAAAFLAITVLGQLCASLVVDHYGLVGFSRDPVTPVRLAGAALLFAGVWLIARH